MMHRVQTVAAGDDSRVVVMLEGDAPLKLPRSQGVARLASQATEKLTPPEFAALYSVHVVADFSSM